MRAVLPEELALPPFRQRFPWWGADLQTLRDCLRPSRPASAGRARALSFPVGEGVRLLGRLDLPPDRRPLALALVIHGLGGSSEAAGPWRLALALAREGLAVLRLNLRGAGAGRSLAPGSYAADCSRDLLPLLSQLRSLAAALAPRGSALPLVGAGISLGGTVLLNAIARAMEAGQPGLDALVCISSPLDLSTCARQFERGRNRLYQRWLVKRLIQQVQADPHGLTPREQASLSGRGRPRSLGEFDACITVPRWGYGSLEHYHAAASPLPRLTASLPWPPLLLLHAIDDPWVPAAPLQALADRRGRRSSDPPANLECCLTARGGHNGFHAPGDGPDGCWSDRFTARWLRRRLPPAPPG